MSKLLADGSEVDVGETGGRPRYDVVITGVEDPAAAEVGGLLTRRRDLVVFGVRPDGREAWIYELRPCPRSLGQVGPALLRRAVRRASRTDVTRIDRQPQRGHRTRKGAQHAGNRVLSRCVR